MRMIRSNEAYQEKKAYIKNLPDTLTLKKFVYHVAYPFLNIFSKSSYDYILVTFP